MNEKINCPYCDEKISQNAKVCPHCRKDVKAKTLGYHVGSFMMVAGLLGLIGSFFIGGIFDPFLCNGLTIILTMVGYVVRKYT